MFLNLFNLLLHNRANFCREIFLKLLVTYFKIVNKLFCQRLHIVFIYKKINKLKGPFTNRSIWILTWNKHPWVARIVQPVCSPRKLTLVRVGKTEDRETETDILMGFRSETITENQKKRKMMFAKQKKLQIFL